jgi:dienelactone hydrolase
MRAHPGPSHRREYGRKDVKHVLPILFLVLCTAACTGGAHHAAVISPAPSLPQSIPWDLAALSHPPEMFWVNDAGPVHSLMYRGEPYNGTSTHVFAYYASPATLAGRSAGKNEFPAIVCVHGGSGRAFSEWVTQWAERGYAAISMDLNGCGYDRERLPDGGPGLGGKNLFTVISEPVTEQWPYHGVANVILAHSLIRSFPEVDTDRIGMTGISWGGYVVCVAAGLDNRFAAAAPVYGCGFLHESSAWLSYFSKMTVEERNRWITLWDPSRYIGAASMPMIFLTGTNDFAYYLDSHQKTCQLVTSPQIMRVAVNMRHSHRHGWAPIEIVRFMDWHLRDGPALPYVGLPARGDSLVAVPVHADIPLTSASLAYTTGHGPIKERIWITTAASIGNGTISAKIPPKGTTMWLFTVRDALGSVISSKVVFERQ